MKYKLATLVITAVVTVTIFPQEEKTAPENNTVQEMVNPGAIPVGSMEEITFMDGLSAKKTASAEDFLILVTLRLGKNYENFAASREREIQSGVLQKDQLSQKDAGLTIGQFSRFLAREKKLKDSLFYNIFGWERYAYTAVAAEGYLPYGRSPRETMTGEELLEAYRLAYESPSADFGADE